MNPSATKPENVTCSPRVSRVRPLVTRHKGLLLFLGAGILMAFVLRGGYRAIWKARGKVGTAKKASMLVVALINPYPEPVTL